MKQLLDHTKFFDVNSYEYNSNSKTGIMLIHGFTNTTFELKKLINFLSSNNLFVIADNLPGHGTTIRDCNSYSYKDWIEFTEKRLAYLSSKCDSIFICGISMGALLAMHLSTVFPVNGLISAAPVLQFHKPIKIKILNPIFRNILKSRRKKYEVNPGEKIYYGYNEWPLIALNELKKLSKYIKQQVIHKIDCPTLLIHSKADQTSVFNNYSIIKRDIKTNNLHSMIVERSTHNIFDCDIEKSIIQARILEFILKYKK